MDDARVEYHHKHLDILQSAIRSEHCLRSNSMTNLHELTTCMNPQRRSKREGVFRMVPAWQLRVGVRIHHAVRATLRGLRRWAEAIPQALCPLVQKVPEKLNIHLEKDTTPSTPPAYVCPDLLLPSSINCPQLPHDILLRINFHFGMNFWISRD